ncbi:hypothetical protein [Nocardia sp. NPDC048505]|uniref:DUF6153 family protein n=1 Tax=unclassified Nocardia TaxID=2637762 RepID=UPI0033FD8CD8
MVDQHPLLRASGATRLLAVLALLAGIVAMHAGVFTVGHSGGSHAEHAAPASEHGHSLPAPVSDSGHDAPAQDSDRPALAPVFGHPTAAIAVATESSHAVHAPTTDSGRTAATPTQGSGYPAAPHSGPACGGAGCDTGHAGLHGCVFILTALGSALLLVLLYYVAVERAAGRPRLPWHWRAERERPPPWTVLSLAELSILRI